MPEDYDDCYECTVNGDDYFINDRGEMECWCPRCYVTQYRSDDDAQLPF